MQAGRSAPVRIKEGGKIQKNKGGFVVPCKAFCCIIIHQWERLALIVSMLLASTAPRSTKELSGGISRCWMKLTDKALPRRRWGGLHTYSHPHKGQTHDVIPEILKRQRPHFHIKRRQQTRLHPSALQQQEDQSAGGLTPLKEEQDRRKEPQRCSPCFRLSAFLPPSRLPSSHLLFSPQMLPGPALVVMVTERAGGGDSRDLNSSSTD